MALAAQGSVVAVEHDDGRLVRSRRRIPARKRETVGRRERHFLHAVEHLVVRRRHPRQPIGKVHEVALQRPERRDTGEIQSDGRDQCSFEMPHASSVREHSRTSALSPKTMATCPPNSDEFCAASPPFSRLCDEEYSGGNDDQQRG
jgi:hypothetical protein